MAVNNIHLAPLGMDLRIDVDEPQDARALLAACESWRGQAEDANRPLRIALRGDDSLRGAGEVRIEASGPTLCLRGDGAQGCAQAASGSAHCRVSPAFLASPDRLRDAVLEPLALFLITRNGRTPIHAAGIAAGDLAVLLAGPSGSGKSCLALAADRAGMQVLSDDTVYLQQRPKLAIRGWPSPVHLLPDDAKETRLPIRIRNGRLKYAVPLRSSNAGSMRKRLAALCILVRGERVALTPLPGDEAMRRLANLEPGFDLLRDDIHEAHRILTRSGAWLLTLSDDPAEAISLIRANISELRTNAVG